MTPDAASKGKEPHVVGEVRWPMAFAVLAVIVLTLLLPYDLAARSRWRGNGQDRRCRQESECVRC